MNLPRLILFFSFIFVLSSCKSQIIIPKNLTEAVQYFEQNWSEKELNNFKNKKESEAVIELHFEIGLWIRNNWIRSDKDTILRTYFNGLEIYAPDDISSIILTSLHRTLNKKQIELKKQIETYKEYWKPIIDCEKKQKSQALSNYNKFKLGDKVKIFMPVDTSNGSRNAVIYNCPNNEWTFDNSKDLVVIGTITKKYFINSTTNVFFTIQINNLNRKDIEILMTKVEIGNEIDFSLSGLKIE